MSKLIITDIDWQGTSCILCAVQEQGKIQELQIQPADASSLLNGIYVAKVETISRNIHAAFLLLGNGQRAFFPLEEQANLIYASGSRPKKTLTPGDEILVQICREAIKSKLPAATANLSLPGNYLVLTTANTKVGISAKLSGEDRKRLAAWFQEESTAADRKYGIILRTNAAQAEKEELFRELAYLKKLFEQVIIHGRNRTCFSVLYRPLPFYMEKIRSQRIELLEEIITDQPEIYKELRDWLSQREDIPRAALRLYQDALLPLRKLYSLESAIQEALSEKVWLKSGGFLVIQQTEAFVSVDVNSGKHIQGKEKEETCRKINLEAAVEIGRQLRLRNLSGIILIDFINLDQPEHQEELLQTLKRIVRQDPVKCTVVDMTPLHILEMTRKKIRRPVAEELREISNPARKQNAGET